MQKKSYFKRYLELFHFLDWKARLMLFFEVYHAFYKIFVIQITASIIGTIETSDPNKLIFLVKIFIALTIGYYISNRLSNMLSDAALPETRNRLYHYYMKRYISMDVTQTDRYGTGKFIGIFSEGIYQISNIYLRLGVDTVVGVLGVLYAIVLVAVQSPNIYYFMAIIAISVVSFSLFWKGIMQMQSARKISKEFTLTGTRQLAKIIMSKMEILQNNKIDGELKVFTETNNGVRDVWIKADNKKHIFQSLANMCFDGGRVFLFLWMGLAVINGSFSIAYLLLLLELLRIVGQYTWDIRMNIKDIFKSSVDIEKLFEVTDEIPSYDYNAWTPFSYKKGDITIKNITFTYGEKSVFHHFSLKLKGWTRTAFVGESWGGKTTLVKLLAWYIRPSEGSISIDGQNLQETKLTDYYKHIWYLTQDPSVFDGTIYENLVYALNEVPSEEALQTVITASKCEFIWEFKKGLQTEIGERGVRLSWGQKQRLAIAKVMLKNPNIIFLDEPTSALDSFNEEQINEALHNLFNGKTVIIVAHRLQTVKQADRILLIEEGKIIEEGTHSELVKLKGKYKRMLDLQSGF